MTLERKNGHKCHSLYVQSWLRPEKIAAAIAARVYSLLQKVLNQGDTIPFHNTCSFFKFINNFEKRVLFPYISQLCVSLIWFITQKSHIKKEKKFAVRPIV